MNNFPFNFPLPYVLQWNINVERELGGNFLAQVGYTGSGAKKLPSVVNVNQAFPGTGNVNARRPYQGIGNIMSYTPYIASTYIGNDRQAGAPVRQGTSPCSRPIPTGIRSTVAATITMRTTPGRRMPAIPRRRKATRTSTSATASCSAASTRCRSASAAASLPPWCGTGSSRSIFSVQTGQPFTVTSSIDPTATGTTARPNRLRDGALPSDQRNINHWFDLTAFAAPACICFGNSGRNILRGPGFMDLDLGVSRQFAIRERVHLLFRAESFNIMNHPNFGIPNMQIGNAQAGIIGSVANPERQSQLALKLLF